MDKDVCACENTQMIVASLVGPWWDRGDVDENRLGRVR